MLNNKKVLRNSNADGFLNESEIREIIRRKILIHESLKNPVYKLILEQGTGVDDIAEQLKDEGFNGTNSARMIRNTANTITVLGNVAATTTIMALPLIPVTFKLKAVAAIAAGTAFANEFIKEIATEQVLGESVKELFMSANGANAKAVQFASRVASGITGGNIKMPQLPVNPAGVADTLGMPPTGVTPNPADYSQFLNDFADALTSTPNFLGIPVSDFTQGTYPASLAGVTLPNWPAFMGNFMHRNIAQAAYTAFSDNCSSMNNDGPKELIKALDDGRFSALDYIYIDYELGRILEGSTSISVKWNGSSGFDDFNCDQSKFLRERNKHGFSNLYFIIKNADVLNNTGPSNYEDEDISVLINDIFGDPAIVNISKNRMFNLSQKIDDVPEKLDVYTLGRGVSSVFPEHGRSSVGGLRGAQIGAGFFDALTVGFMDRVQAFLESAWNYITSAISSLPATLSALWSAVTSAFSSGLSAVGGFFAAVGAWLASLWTSISGGGGGSGTTRTARTARTTRRIRPEVQEMQRIMNKINTDKGLGGTAIAEDGIWGSETDTAWELVTNYAFASGILNSDPDASTYDTSFHNWPTMSRSLRDNNGTNYPGYTANPQGALNMIKDIDNGNTDLGLGSSLAGSGSGAGGTGTTRSAGTPSTRGQTSLGGTITTSGIRIQIDSGNNPNETLEDLGYPPGTTQNVADAILRSIQSEYFTGTGEAGLNLEVHFDRYGMVNNTGGVRRASTQRRIPVVKNFKSLLSEIKDVLRSSGRISQLVDPNNPTVTNVKRNGKQKKVFKMSVTIPSGVKQRS